MSILLDSITRKVGREVHINNISLELASGTTNVILGHTLAGKTSLLRLMAGLDKPTLGSIYMNDIDVTGLSVRKRNVAMVYQQFINYPSMNIYKNIASPLIMSGMNHEEIDQKVLETASMLHIEDLLDRLPSELSGGQQQRTAIARSLVSDADLLLLDEPLVNLDYKLREELQVELQDIFKQRDAIVVYTTSEPTEALIIGGNIIVIDEGIVLQTGPTSSVYHNPATLKTAQIFSDPPINYLNAIVDQKTAKIGLDINIPLTAHLQTLSNGEFIFGIRPNHLNLFRKSDNDVEIKVKVELAELNGSETFIHVKHGDFNLVLQEDGIHTRPINLEIKIYIDPYSIFVFDKNENLIASPFQNESSRRL